LRAFWDHSKGTDAMNAITNETQTLVREIGQGVASGRLIPYIGPGVLETGEDPGPGDDDRYRGHDDLGNGDKR
jgi:hypothetical protein